MKQAIALPLVCLLVFGTTAAACAADRSQDRLTSEDVRQPELGRQIVSDTQRNEEVGQQQGQDQQLLNEQMRPEGNAMGVPEPGTVSDQETTQKQRDPARRHGADDNAQVTMGGAKSAVSGEVLRIDGDNYFVRDRESGEEVKLIVNTDTNLDCGASSAGGGNHAIASPDRQPDQSGDTTQRQQAQGQRSDETAMGSGFSVGGCTFQQGDRVKAEVSDLGTVTTLRILSPDQQAEMRSSSVQIEGTSTMESVSENDTRDKSPSSEKLMQDKEGSLAPQDLR
jgi:hypothetical protein